MQTLCVPPWTDEILVQVFALRKLLGPVASTMKSTKSTDKKEGDTGGRRKGRGRVMLKRNLVNKRQKIDRENHLSTS